MERNEFNRITPQLLEKLKIEAMLREDELAIKTDKLFEKAGTLNDPDLCEIANGAEDFSIIIQSLEKLLEQIGSTGNQKMPQEGDR